MRTLLEVKILVALLSAIILVAVGCAAPATTTTPTPAPVPSPAPTATATPTPTGPSGELQYAVSSFGTESFDVFNTSLADTWSRLTPLFDYLVRTDPSEKVSTGIAEKWELAPDGLSWTFYIRKGITFHDGSTLTAQDVKFSLDEYSSTRAFYADIRNAQERVEIQDEYTVRVFTKGVQPYYFRLVDFLVAQQGLIVPKSYFEKVGKDGFSQRPIGSGPFKFVRSVPGDLVEYEALDKHYRQVPAFKKLVVSVIPEETTRLAMLKTGGADAIEIGVDTADEVEAAGARTASLAGVQTGVYFYGSYDARAKGMPTADTRVRQALSLAINRAEMGRTLLNGKLAPPMPPSIRPSQPEVDVPYWSQQATKYYGYDPAAATQLLKDAGFPQGFNIKMYSYSLSGAPLTKLAEVVQSYWLRIGVKAEIVPIDWGAFRPGIKGGPAGGPTDQLVGQVALHRTDGSIMPGRALTAPFLSTGSFNLTQKAIPGLEDLISGSLTQTDTGKRKDMIAKAIQLSMDSHVVSVIGTVPAMVGLGPRVDINFPGDAGSLVQYADIAKHRK